MIYHALSKDYALCERQRFENTVYRYFVINLNNFKHVEESNMFAKLVKLYVNLNGPELLTQSSKQFQDWIQVGFKGVRIPS